MEQPPREILARLRSNLDFMPSPVEDRPGLLIRDPHQYSDVTLIIPPALAGLLELFDGRSTRLDLRATLVRLTGDLQSGEFATRLAEALQQAGFLEDETYARMREARHSEFARASTRPPAHAGAAYPGEAAPLRELFDGYFSSASRDGASDGLIGIAAPHVSPEGGWESYRDSYRQLGPECQDRVFVVLGTSHYGAPERFGLTRKNYVTPAGESRTEGALVERLAQSAPGAVIMEDYCHANEHSIEFQVAFLQHVCGPGVRILPILCGPFGRSLFEGGMPEDDEDVRRFLDALTELHLREAHRLMWVLGIDMAHIGRRYGDRFPALAGRDAMLEVEARDRARIAMLEAGDAEGFWGLVQQAHDDLRWCGSAPLYSFLRAVPQARAHLLRYQQWQIDPESVVSFSALAFHAR